MTKIQPAQLFFENLKKENRYPKKACPIPPWPFSNPQCLKAWPEKGRCSPAGQNEWEDAHRLFSGQTTTHCPWRKHEP